MLDTPRNQNGEAFLDAPGYVADLLRRKDWSSSALGLPRDWHPSLKTMVRMMLTTRHPVFIFWGPDHLCLYNDAYSEFLGADKHPCALGAKACDVWSEIWDAIRPQIDLVMRGEGATWHENQRLPILRDGVMCEVFWTYSYGPIDDDTAASGVGGVLVLVTDTTRQMVNERRLALEKERFAALFEQAPTFMAVLRGPNHMVEFVNPGYMKLVGHRDVVGKNVADALPDAAEQGFVQLLDKVYASGTAFSASSYKYDVQVHPGGHVSERFVDFVYQPIRDSHNAVTGIFVEGVDVTERARADAVLRKTAERLSLVVDGATDHAILTIDPQGLISSWSAGAVKIFGWTADEMVGRAYGTIFTASDRAHRIDAQELETAAKDGSAPDKRWHVRRDGSLVFLNGSVHPLQVGAQYSAQGFLKIARDETERVRDELAREALVTLTEAFRDLESIEDIGSAASEVLAKCLGISRVGFGTVEGDTDKFHVDGDWSAEGVGTLARDLHLRDFGSYIDNLRLGELLSFSDVRLDPRTAAGAEALEARSSRAFVNVPIIEHGRLVAILFASNASVRHWDAKDIALIEEVAARTRTAIERVRSSTALRESELRLREANATLEAKVQERTRDLVLAQDALRQSQKMEAVGQLTGGLAHDFNNLLAAITGSLELLRRRTSEGRLSEAERYVEASLGAARRAAALTHRLLAFSRRQTLAPTALNPNRLIADMEDLIRRTMGPHITLETVSAVGLWTVHADASQLENALLNLCINSRDAMPNGGKLTIETANRWVDERTALGRDLEPGQYVSLCVSDNGVGMSAEVTARAFDPFFTTKPLGLGTGLGLSMIYGFAKQSGGQARIYSEVGQGTMVCLYLPRHLAPEDAPEEPAAQTGDLPRAVQGQTVLIVDDEPVLRMLIVDLMADLGYATLQAGDGAEALKFLAPGARIDLLVTDVGLPGGMNGRQVADAARVHRPALKVLFITGYAENAVLSHGHLDAGMHVMTKPFDIDVFAKRAKELIEAD